MEILADHILFKVDKEFEDQYELKNGLVLYKDTSFEPGRHKRLFGHVLSTPKFLSDRTLRQIDPGPPTPLLNRTSEDITLLKAIGVITPEDKGTSNEITFCSSPYLPENILYNALEMEVQVGDKIYFNFLATDSANKVKETILHHDGSIVFAIPYHTVWCVVRDGVIFPVAEHVFVEKVVRQDGLQYLPEINGYGYINDLGIVEELGANPSYLEGVVKYSAKPLKGEKELIFPGDHILYLPDSDFENTIEGESFYVMKHHEVIAKVMNKNKLQPIGDRVLVLPNEADAITKNGLIIPDTAKQKPNMGTVVSVGTTTKYLKTGDQVLYGKYAGTDVGMDGKDYIIMRESDVMMVVEKEPAVKLVSSLNGALH